MAVNNGYSDKQPYHGSRVNGSNNEQNENCNTQYMAGTVSPDDVGSGSTIFNPYYTGRPRTPAGGTKSTTIDRQDIIRRIKSGESRPTSPELDRSPLQDVVRKRKSPIPYSAHKSPPTIPRPRTPTTSPDSFSIGSQIERPRSALHRGDFWDSGQATKVSNSTVSSTISEAQPSFSTSPVAPWHRDFPPALRPSPNRHNPYVIENTVPLVRPVHARTASNASLAASFAYKPPTSPLAQSSRPDTPEISDRPASPSPDKSRRHTFSPQSFRHFTSSPYSPLPNQYHEGRPTPPSLRLERTVPYQAHQPRRSLTSSPFSSLPQTPLANSRRPSISESPLHHAPMVGSYEESILRGRMSTTPSKPLNFVAQIGVLGRGDCKPSLRCPPHSSIPFPAVFYSYGNSGKTAPLNDQPSPYVGLIDLEHNVSGTSAPSQKRRQRLHGTHSGEEGSRASSRTREDVSTSERRRKQKDKRRSGSPRAPPGGSYRIPQQGQLQIVIKNPNKTAVKLFLVPYDLTDMEPGQKTFIRQRSYSAGPIIDMPLSSRKNLGTDRPEAALSASDDPNERPTLRYLIHLHICSPSKGRFFLYKSIRVVFANRVPDGKEKLRNEIQLPEPKYSAYKPGRDSTIHIVNGYNDHSRRSNDLPSHASDPHWPRFPRTMAQSLPASEFGARYEAPMQALPRQFTTLPTLESRPSSRQTSDCMEIDSQQSQDTQSVRSPLSSPTSDRPPLKLWTQFEEQFNFERDSSRERARGGRSESLLSKRLMDLAFQNQASTSDDA